MTKLRSVGHTANEDLRVGPGNIRELHNAGKESGNGFVAGSFDGPQAAPA